MIANEGELRASLGLLSTITDEERTVLLLLHPLAEAKIKEYIGYDPEQKTVTEHFPRHTHAGGGGLRGGGFWDSNTAHTHAVFEREATSGAVESLQTQRLPLRTITTLKVDSNARFGKGTDPWPTGSDWTEGQDYWPEYEQADFCLSGLLDASGAWPVTPGSVELVSLSGYSPDELAGRATATGTSSGIITTAGVSAIGIKQAVIIQVTKGFQTWAANKKSSRLGFLPGVLNSEKIGDYSYTIDSSLAAEAGGLMNDLAPEAAQHADPFVNWGYMRL